MWTQYLGAMAAMLLVSSDLAAAGLDIVVVDQKGAPAASAVVMLRPEKEIDTAAVPASKATTTIIDQVDETFVPFVTAIRTGESVEFRNSERVRHHVYSFSKLKPFELENDPGELSAPVRFDEPGVVALGCNIHDDMLAFVFVASSPWAAVVGADGRTRFDELPAGSYVAEVWHPRLKPGSGPPVEKVAIGAGRTEVSFSLRLSDQKRQRGHQHDY